MQNDFKENYIEEQKKKAAERRARLAKIGMGVDQPATSVSSQRERGTQTGRAPGTRPEGAPEERRVQQTKPSARPAPQGQVRPASQGQTSSQPRPDVRREQQGQVQRPQAQQGQPQRTQTQQPVTQRPQQPQRPAPQAQDAGQVQAPQKTAQPQRPSNPSANRSSVSYGGYTQRRRVAPTDEELFKKYLSDNESRAMMFALTGKADQPDDGGDVDIINMGRIKAPKKSDDEDKKKKSRAGVYVGRSFAVLGLVLVFLIVTLFSSVFVIAHGPSRSIRDLLVLTADHSSAAKWVPHLFLPGDVIEGILNKSEETVRDVVSIDQYIPDPENDKFADKWEHAKDGMIFETVSGPTFKAYVLLVKDPSRIFVGTSAESLAGKPYGDDIFHITEFYGAVAAINGGEFPDNGGGGTGHTPIGLTYSKGECVHNDGHTDRTFLGITKDNKLVVNEGMTEKRADELGIRDAVSFQKGNTLIQQEGDELIFHYQDGNTGVAQRTGIGQRADGTVILVVTDGRTASSLGATHNDMIDLMVSYGAVTAGLLDGGSSSLMYYRDYYDKYGYDYEKLDEYQKKGLVNNYKAFTEPRKIPTFFIVSAETAEN